MPSVPITALMLAMAKGDSSPFISLMNMNDMAQVTDAISRWLRTKSLVGVASCEAIVALTNGNRR